jgi:hypothetical protein
MRPSTAVAHQVPYLKPDACSLKPIPEKCCKTALNLKFKLT